MSLSLRFRRVRRELDYKSASLGWAPCTKDKLMWSAIRPEVGLDFARTASALKMGYDASNNRPGWFRGAERKTASKLSSLRKIRCGFLFRAFSK